MVTHRYRSRDITGEEILFIRKLIRDHPVHRSIRCSGRALSGDAERFAKLPWVQVEHLASHLLGRMARLVPQDWQRIYAHPIYWLETFVDTSRFRGTCYRAANWQVIGTTAGRGHRAPTLEPTRPVKQMLGLPLHRRFREILSQ